MGDNKDAYWTPPIDQISTIGARRLPTKGAVRLGGRFAPPLWRINTLQTWACIYIHIYIYVYVYVHVHVHIHGIIIK